LRPAFEELEAVIRHCREHGLKIGKRTKVEELWRHLEARDTESAD
jgi:hypothetical protein